MAKFRKRPIIVDAVEFTEEMILDDTKRPNYVIMGRLERCANGKRFAS